MKAPKLKGLPKPQRAMAYRAWVLASACIRLESWRGPKNVDFNILLECFAMQARILLEVLGVVRLDPNTGRPHANPKQPRATDVRATQITPTWPRPTNILLARWLDAADRAAAHPTVKRKPNWNVKRITMVVLTEIQSVLEHADAIRVRRALKEWLRSAIKTIEQL